MGFSWFRVSRPSLVVGDFRGLSRCFSRRGPLVAQEMERAGIEEFTAKNDKIVQVSELVWLLTNSDEVNLNSPNINKKVLKCSS